MTFFSRTVACRIAESARIAPCWSRFHEQQFSGVVFSGYGAIAGAVGIATRPELVEEIRTTAESISRRSATELCHLTAETERLSRGGEFLQRARARP